MTCLLESRPPTSGSSPSTGETSETRPVWNGGVEDHHNGRQDPSGTGRLRGEGRGGGRSVLLEGTSCSQ